MPANQKYIFINGIPAINPDYRPAFNPDYQPDPQDIQRQSAFTNGQALTIVSTMDDVAAMGQLTKLGAPPRYQETIQTMQDSPYIQAFQTPGIDGGMLIDGLTKIFARNEIPIGLMSKLTPLQGATLHFKIDNSGSMSNDSNLLRRDASWYAQQTVHPAKNILTRWEEAEDRLHILIDLLGYIPTGPIILSLFDHPRQNGTRITLDRRGKLPEVFLDEAHTAIHQLFQTRPGGSTPILYNMKNMLKEANDLRAGTDSKTLHYLLSDGEPDGTREEIRMIKDLLMSSSRNASSNPFTFLGCSNQRIDYAWMHELEEIAPYVAALPDFKDEQIEVLRDQGKAFPYSRGFWLLCNLAAAMNPDDLDAMDEHAPFTKTTIENLMGRQLIEEEYLQYFNLHPNAQRIFGPDYKLFLTSQRARDIPSVRLFNSVLAKGLSKDMDNDEDDTEMQEVRRAEQAVLDSRSYSLRAPGMMFGTSYGRRERTDEDDTYTRPSQPGCCTLI